MSGIHFKAVEVREVSTDTDTTDSGMIWGRYVIDQQNAADSEILPFLPLEPNIKQIPLRGEIVLGTIFLGTHYYTSQINVRNNEKSNAVPGISQYSNRGGVPEELQLGNYFTPNEKSKKLVVNEGDTIIQGRFGNSIRLGSNQIADFAEENLEIDSKKYTDSPNIKIVTGMNTNFPSDSNFHYEDLELEKSSIYLTTNEEIEFQHSDRTITSLEEPQITIKSDSIVFNGKKNVTIYSDNINLGDDRDLESAVLGKKLLEVLTEIVDIIENTNIGAGGGTLPLPFLGKLKQIVSDKILSKNVKLK
jgi:hypothetical protein